MKKNRTPFQLWFMPAFIGLISFGGLLNALLYDGWGDAISWILLGIPVIVVGYFWRKKGSEKKKTKI